MARKHSRQRMTGPSGVLRSVIDFGALRAVVDSGELNTNPPLTCVTPGVPPFTCNRSEAYFFEDGIHPTEKGHAIFADIALPPLESLMASP